MKFINKFKSPNFNKRKFFKIEFIIIHYTAIKDYENAISFLCNEKNRVSCHFLISQKGNIYSLVDEDKRAWHAGQSFWNSNLDINSSSLGIELDYSHFKKNNKFSKKMINSLIALIKYLKNKYKIENKNILGHSDIAPFRKIDPGPKFPWQTIRKNDLVFNPNKRPLLNILILKKWLTKCKIITNRQIAIFILGYIGYDTSEIICDKKYLIKIIRAYKINFMKESSYSLDNRTINFMIKHFSNLILTKN